MWTLRSVISCCTIVLLSSKIAFCTNYASGNPWPYSKYTTTTPRPDRPLVINTGSGFQQVTTSAPAPPPVNFFPTSNSRLAGGVMQTNRVVVTTSAPAPPPINFFPTVNSGLTGGVMETNRVTTTSASNTAELPQSPMMGQFVTLVDPETGLLYRIPVVLLQRFMQNDFK